MSFGAGSRRKCSIFFLSLSLDFHFFPCLFTIGVCIQFFFFCFMPHISFSLSISSGISHKIIFRFNPKSVATFRIHFFLSFSNYSYFGHEVPSSSTSFISFDALNSIRYHCCSSPLAVYAHCTYIAQAII